MRRDRPFSQVLQDALEEPRHRRPLRSSFYADAVSAYLRTFPGAVHVLFLEELARDPGREMSRIFDFLGIEAVSEARHYSTVHNAHALPRSRLAGVLHNSPRVRAAARLIAPLGVRLRLQQLLVKPHMRNRIEPEMDAVLTKLFSPDVERLRTILDRDVPWARFSV